jgi:hypothetical protein
MNQENRGFIAWFKSWWQRLTKSEPGSHHDVRSKQSINLASPEKDRQIDFINEGGNSQPLDKVL